MTTGATDRRDLAATFRHAGVAKAYEHRPPYPPEVFDVLTGLITDQPRTVLDLGAGEGALARPMAALVDQVDAIDISAAMVAAAGAVQAAAGPTCAGWWAPRNQHRSSAPTRWSAPVPACTGCRGRARCLGSQRL